HAFLCTGVFESAWPHDHLSGHSGRAVAGRAARARLAGSPGEPPRDDGRSAPRGTLRPDVGRRAQANGARAAERAGVRQEQCGDIHRGGKRGLSVCGCSDSTNLTFDCGERIGAKNMANLKVDKEITALLVIDPYNDFISEGGKLWDRLKGVAEANKCVPHMMQVLDAARKAGIRVLYALHHRYRPGDYETWKYIAPVQKAAWLHKTFEYGTWGGEICREFEPQPGDVVAHGHWCSSGFANTDLDL